jgi:nucleotide-binding universal stress UspA family protein
VLAAIDLVAPHETAQGARDRLVVELASGLAARDGAELRVVHAMAADGGADAGARAVVRAELAAATGLPEERIVLIEGVAGAAVAAYAAAWPADVLVFGMPLQHAQGAEPGGTAAAVLAQPTCALLAVKPEGFVSPVRLDGGE